MTLAFCRGSGLFRARGFGRNRLANEGEEVLNGSKVGRAAGIDMLDTALELAYLNVGRRVKLNDEVPPHAVTNIGRERAGTG